MSRTESSTCAHASAPVVRAWTATCAAGLGRAAFSRALRQNERALLPNSFTRTALTSWVGVVNAADGTALPPALATLDARINRLAWLALQQDDFTQQVQRAVARHGAARVGLVLGTSSSSIGESEAAYQRRAALGHFDAHDLRPEVHTLHSPTLFVQRALELTGLSLTVSTACSSSAKAFGVARRWLAAGLADAVVVGGVDALCNSVLFGFAALQLLSPTPCRPFDARRDGLNLGEAAAFALLERAGSGPRLLGVGESSDAHHLSAPHPRGLGARLAMQAALDDARCQPGAIDFIHLHGTGTPLNDVTEAGAVAALWPAPPHAASTKGAFGHTLGAAGLLGAAACWVALDEGWRAGTVGLEQPDAVLPLRPATSPLQAPTGLALANAFGFGGTNVSLVFGRAD